MTTSGGIRKTGRRTPSSIIMDAPSALNEPESPCSSKHKWRRGVVYCLARALHSEDLRTWCSARVSQWLVLRRVRGGVLRPP